jgi:hypothetical protein
MRYYRVTIKHDTGKDRIKVLAHDIEQAITMIIKGTQCPRSAIVSIKEVN